jgi:hypothetical protein
VACAGGPNVNRTLIEPNCEETILHFKLIFNDKIYSKFNISPILGLIKKKSPPKNPTHLGLPIIARICPNFFIKIIIIIF